MLMQVPKDTRYARFLHDKFIQLDGNLSTPVNTGAEQYCYKGWMLIKEVYNE